MKRAASVRLRPTADQADLLPCTLETCNPACDWLTDLARQAKTRRQYDLHRLGYAEMRGRFGIVARVAVRCMAKAADSLTV